MSRLLVVIDYQNDFVNGALGFAKAETLEKVIEVEAPSREEAVQEVEKLYNNEEIVLGAEDFTIAEIY